jgi:hypothetical protein
MWLSAVHVLDAQATKKIYNCCIATTNKELFIFLGLIRDICEVHVSHTTRYYIPSAE